MSFLPPNQQCQSTEGNSFKALYKFPALLIVLLLLLMLTLVVMSVQAVVGVAGGATRAALTQHQARRNNMADVSAKDGSQVQHRVAIIEVVQNTELIPG